MIFLPSHRLIESHGKAWQLQTHLDIIFYDSAPRTIADFLS